VGRLKAPPNLPEREALKAIMKMKQFFKNVNQSPSFGGN